MLPWVRSLTIAGPILQRFISPQCCPNLLECVAGITTFHDFHPGYSLDPTVVTPCLRRLCVEEDRFLLHLTAPLLEELSSECPSVTELLLVMEYDEDEGDEDTFDQDQIALFSAIQIFGTPAGLCPNLTSLVFGYATSISAWDLFFAMAQSHFARHLTHLRIFNAGDLDVPPPDNLLTQTRDWLAASRPPIPFRESYSLFKVNTATSQIYGRLG
ncbi:hypothetical protein B0H13DRAFT_2285037 [Mycena leptocephala]|nr:hypothetical protein B0H13DRAFT_2285037 [Mycena leptocephala]